MTNVLEVLMGEDKEPSIFWKSIMSQIQQSFQKDDRVIYLSLVLQSSSMKQTLFADKEFESQRLKNNDLKSVQLEGIKTWIQLQSFLSPKSMLCLVQHIEDFQYSVAQFKFQYLQFLSILYLSKPVTESSFLSPENISMCISFFLNS